MVYFRSDNIISSLGITTEENFTSMIADKIGIQPINDQRYYPEVFPGSLIDEDKLDKEFKIIAVKYSNNNSYTKLEKMIIGHTLECEIVDQDDADQLVAVVPKKYLRSKFSCSEFKYHLQNSKWYLQTPKS